MAKSKGGRSKAARERARREAQYPKGKRHEFVSAGVVAANPEMLAKAHDPELLLYLITVHHGFGRSLCLDQQEVEQDTALQTRDFEVHGVPLTGPVDQRFGQPTSGHTERFWRLVEKYGWWNLAMLESLLVCADQLCSKDPMALRPALLQAAATPMRPDRSSDRTGSFELSLLGPDGANLLGFLCSLGTLRTLSQIGIDAKLSWRLEAKWTPVLHLPGPLSPAQLSSNLARQLGSTRWQSPMDIEDNTHKLDLRNFNVINREARDSWLQACDGTREWSDWVCALAGEVDNKGCATDTAFRTMSGAGHQHFLKTMRDLKELTEEHHVFATLFGFWSYEEGKPTLRFDPLDDRRYALRWSDPSQSTKDPIRSVRGANRLAIEALPLFPTWPTQKKLETAGFTTGGAKNTFFYWPIWTGPLSCRAIRSLLWNRKWPEKDPVLLKSLSIAELYRVQRITMNKVRNFTPSQALGRASSTNPIGASPVLRC
jgi:hypothetical protein